MIQKPRARFGASALLTGAFFVVSALPLLAQETPDAQEGPRAMTVDDFALWRTVGQAGLSPDGRWVTYAYSQREVDDSLFIRRLDGGGDPYVVLRGSNPTFTADSRWVAYYVNPEEESGGRGAAAGGGGGGRGRGGGGGGAARSLELRNLETGDTRTWENVQSFAFADEAGALVIKKRALDSDAEYDGTDLLVRYLDAGEEELISYVNEWGVDEGGTRLAYTLDTPDGESNGVSLLDLSTRMRRVLDAEREVEYSQLTWGDDEDEPAADALAVLKGKDDDDWVERVNALLAWPDLSASTAPVVLDPRPAEDEAEEGDGTGEDGNGEARSGVPVNGLPADWVLSEKGGLTWAPDASRLFLATRYQQPDPSTLCEPPEEEGGRVGRGGRGAAADSTDAEDQASDGPKIFRMATRTGPDGRPLGPEEVDDGTCPEFVADVDIWHVEDDRLQSVQIIRANRDRNQTYESVVHVDGGVARFVQLADTTMESLDVSDRGDVAMGSDPRPYVSDWEPSYRDYYLVDLDTGERKLVLEKHLRTLGFSPDGDDFLYWKDRNVWAYRVGSGEHVNLTESVPVTFEDEEYDRFGEKPPHGIAAWTADSASVILEHRYDLWEVPLDGGQATDLTGGMGAREEIQLRLVDLDPDEELVDLDEPQVLTAYGQWTKKAGFYRLDDGDLQELVYDDASFGRVQKADSADVILWTREDFRTFPDYQVSGLDFADPEQVTDANPQQSDFRWGHTVLIEYETHDGVRLQGVLAVPDGYEPGQKLPMLVDFYEKMSQRLNSYPRPTFRDTPMVAHYVSAGYLVLLPDVHFRLGPTHDNMLEGINLAIDEVERLGYVDPDRIGLHGHSFSGQGSVYIATHSDRFAAIVPGAAASDLVADFNQLWKSAGTNQHGYDIYGQGRFATNPYDDLELFIDQSGTFNAGNATTPILLLHGTADGSVEWLQAVEFFNALRWFGKNVILASYPDEPHHLTRYENQKDFQIRMRQFYDHYLMEAPAPRWMTDGRTFLQKERDRAMVEEGGNGGGNGGGRGGGGGS